MTDITVPTLGESVTEATVGKWLKAAGDAVAKDDVLVELETDKVAVEVSAEAAGTLSEIVAAEGDTVEIGALLGRLGGANGAAKAAPAPAAEPAAASAPAAAPAAGGATVDVTVPSMGESVAEGTIASFAKQVGDAVAKDETIAEIETDKVALEVPASADGVIAEWLVAEGDGVKPGAVVDLEGAVENEEDLIAADARDWWYGQAQEMYQAVWDATGEESGRPMTSIGAAFGLGSIAESRGDLDAAGEWYATAGRVAESAKLPNFVSLAEQRSSEMVAVADRPVLISSVNLPTPPENELDRIRREFNRQSMPDLDMEPLEIPDVFGELGGDADDAGDEPVPAGPALPETPSETPDER